MEGRENHIYREMNKIPFRDFIFKASLSRVNNKTHSLAYSAACSGMQLRMNSFKECQVCLAKLLQKISSLVISLKTLDQNIRDQIFLKTF